MKITRYFKAFALSGRLADCYYTQGDCPGLGASALSGRVELTCKNRISLDSLKSASNLNGNLNCSKELEHYAS